MSPRTGRIAAALVACATLSSAAPAQAGEVTVVDGARSVVRESPVVPGGAAAKLGPEPRRAKVGAIASARRPTARVSSAAGRKAVKAAIRRARLGKKISSTTARRYLRIYALANARVRRLGATRRAELGGVIANTEAMATRGALDNWTRLYPAFLILRRNTEFWPLSDIPGRGGYVSFRGSELLFEYYPGEGLQLQPLANFKQANAMHGACVKREGECRKEGLRLLLREMIKTSVKRSGFRAWEYYFDFGGGAPPWISGMATATGIQAFGRAGELLRTTVYRKWAQRSFGAFKKPPPTGIATTGPLGGTHYLQYSFAPRLYIINAFLQSVIGLYDYAEATGDKTARALFANAEPQARRELTRNDIGDWSTYSFGGAASTLEYHELLREFAASLCSRLRTSTYCATSKRFQDYATKPPKVGFAGPEVATKGRATAVRFSLSKLSAVQVTITRAGKTVYDKTVTLSQGDRSLSWTPRAGGEHRVRVAAKELRTGRSLRSSDSSTIDVEPKVRAGATSP